MKQLKDKPVNVSSSPNNLAETDTGASSANSIAPVANVGPARQSGVSLARMLLDAQILSSQEIADAQRAAREARQSLGSYLVLDGLVPSRDLATLIALNLGISMVDLRNQTLDSETVELIPEEVARKYLVLPVKRAGNVLTVAMTDPTCKPCKTWRHARDALSTPSWPPMKIFRNTSTYPTASRQKRCRQLKGRLPTLLGKGSAPGFCVRRDPPR